MKKKVLLMTLGFLTLSLAIPAGTYWWLDSSIPQVEILTTTPEMASGKRIAPLFEVMIPLPTTTDAQILPELEYRKGPPSRYLHRIVMRLMEPGADKAKETLAVYGRRTRTDSLFALSLKLGKYRGGGAEARFVRDAILYSQNRTDVSLSLRFAYLAEARRHLQNVNKAWIMEQAGNPAFLLQHGDGAYDALYSRQNSFYKVEFRADNRFKILDPISQFRTSFVTERRADALDYVARELSSVAIENRSVQAGLSLAKAEWPLSLLAALVSLEPASLEGYFHFAGLSALLYKSPTSDRSSQETLDVLRNNVLVSEFYAKDINPEADKTKEISRLARTLLKSFQ